MKRQRTTVTKTQPKKYVINPEYAKHKQEFEKEDFVETIYNGMALVGIGVFSGNPFAAGEAARAEHMSWFPEDFGAQIPEEGCWILVTKPPHTEIKINRFSIWYAMPEVRTKESGFALHLARILTPVGDLWLWPHEYSKIEIAKYLDFVGEGFEINYFSEAAEIDADKLHYVMSRGIKRPDALRLLLPTLQSQTVCWLEAHEELRGAFARH